MEHDSTAPQNRMSIDARVFKVDSSGSIRTNNDLQLQRNES